METVVFPGGSKWTLFKLNGPDERALTTTSVNSGPNPDSGDTISYPWARQIQRRLNTDEVTRLVERYQTGALIKELASEFGVNRQTVSKLLVRAGVPLRQRGLNASQVADRSRATVQSGLVTLSDRRTAQGRPHDRPATAPQAWRPW
ncbi:helix-turn-helix domain-containing protein [Rhodococcus sp. NM-2]|uniref:helix-turn-helix domain-containing protein n=1 Tax=Rhodococcus sp. NM-2 TaxID=3401174 RepID=UPI003AADC01E